MAATPIRIGIIGAGGIVTRRHLPGLAQEEDVQVVAVCNRRRESGEAVAREWNIPHVVDSPEALIARDDIDTVMIGTTPYLHRDLTVAALQAGKHVFCQARMARTVAEARDMLDAAAAHPRQVAMLCPAPHVMPGQAYVQGVLERGELGDLRLVRLQHLSESTLSAEAPYHWRMDRQSSGYNVLTLGIYAEIMHRWVGTARTVAATGGVYTPRRPEPDTGKMRDVRIPESIVVTGELENGAHYVYTFSGVAAYAPGDRIELYGTRGTLVYDVPSHQIYRGEVQATDEPVRVGKVTEKQAPQPVEIPAAERGEWRVEAEFVRAIREGTPVFPDFRDGVQYMEFVEAAGRALAEGRTLRLPLA